MKSSSKVDQHLRCIMRLGLQPIQSQFQKTNTSIDSVYRIMQTDENRAKGAYGAVTLAETNNGEIVAIKLFTKEPGEAEKLRISTMLLFSQSNDQLNKFLWPQQLIRYRKAYEFLAAPALPQYVLEMNAIQDSLTLAQLLQSSTLFPGTAWQRWMQDILTAVAFLHRNGFVHRDIHTDNIMVPVSLKGYAVLIDLDLSCSTRGECNQLCLGPATPRASPPDLWCEADLVPIPSSAQWMAGDIWSTGSAFASCVARADNFIANRLGFTIDRSQNCKKIDSFKLLQTTQSALRLLNNQDQSQLLYSMLDYDWKKRPTALQALNRIAEINEKTQRWSSGDEWQQISNNSSGSLLLDDSSGYSSGYSE